MAPRPLSGEAPLRVREAGFLLRRHMEPWPNAQVNSREFFREPGWECAERGRKCQSAGERKGTMITSGSHASPLSHSK